MKLCAEVEPEKVKIVGEATGAKFDGTETPAEIGEKTAAAMRALMKAAGYKAPKEYNMDREKFIDTAAHSMQVDLGLRLNCPFEPTEEICRGILERSYDND